MGRRILAWKGSNTGMGQKFGKALKSSCGGRQMSPVMGMPAP